MGLKEVRETSSNIIPFATIKLGDKWNEMEVRTVTFVDGSKVNRAFCIRQKKYIRTCVLTPVVYTDKKETIVTGFRMPLNSVDGCLHCEYFRSRK